MTSAERRSNSRPRDSEVHAYEFIKRTLAALGWDTRNPERADAGRVWTQNECLSNSHIRDCLGLERPENIVKVGEDTLWIIEAKRSHGQLDQALGEAEDYAQKFRNSPRYRALFCSGVAGNDIDSFLSRTSFWNGRRYVPVTLNGVSATGLLNATQLQQVLDSSNANIADPQVDERLFLSRAERINETLHLGAVNPHQRAGVMAALLLSMLSSTPPNIEERQPHVLIGDINARVSAILQDQGKPEFYEYIKIALPSTPDNHVKLRRALVDTLQELNTLNIRSAMNSGADWLGAFYEVFLKYASWAQDLGIVLTPRHITRFVADVMDVGIHDLIYDPTCGTGGFLVAAFDYVKNHAMPAQLAQFKKHAVFGIEQDAGVAALAIVNMIFRGDGKNNIQEGNCFSRYLNTETSRNVRTARYVDRRADDPPITKVMMNPPFALKRDDEKEYRFIDQALAQMQDGGLLFSVLPYPALVKPGAYYTWRRSTLLPHHTVLAVITFPEDIFYPVAVHSLGIFIRKGQPHASIQNVLWMRAVRDGLSKQKGRRLPDSRAANDLSRGRDTLKAFLHDPGYSVSSEPQFQKA
jgi:type I restriction enzyme M protein